ncbi:hypothetical protein SLNWT_6866 [Streptomyces albus]|uniref:Uncharacterized protein n=1 Tax=Streptomyces albus (strain ATCC 21838 / DSM 41398 / FERM P-419 / JCM 4703 / NBRC 107858) TaxID=1081613 RepID=A0A0B5F9T8_STRA4|nr:hypothetical protein SLNWT_6866 [Streptomyces albus]AOU81546.1 hypothetical protein SLNHY_6855 [Streptomyces albus]AYN37240.1 hypothetical protein DUI70_6747 [Streptomyces albus]
MLWCVVLGAQYAACGCEGFGGSLRSSEVEVAPALLTEHFALVDPVQPVWVVLSRASCVDFADGGSDRLVDALVASGEDSAALPLDQWRSLAHLTRRTGRPVA